jgi:hypothetical protein
MGVIYQRGGEAHSIEYKNTLGACSQPLGRDCMRPTSLAWIAGPREAYADSGGRPNDNYYITKGI